MNIKEIFLYTLAAIIVIGFFVFLFLLLLSKEPIANKDLMSLIIGALIGNFGLVVGYFYGASIEKSK